jgi:hypothetical protein
VYTFHVLPSAKAGSLLRVKSTLAWDAPVFATVGLSVTGVSVGTILSKRPVSQLTGSKAAVKTAAAIPIRLKKHFLFILFFSYSKNYPKSLFQNFGTGAKGKNVRRGAAHSRRPAPPPENFR